MTIAVGVIGFCVLLFAGVPILYVTLGWGVVWLIATGKAFLLMEAPSRVFTGLDSFTLLAIPLFILAGELMNSGGLTLRILKLSEVLVGRIRGGLAYANIIASTIFGGISGASLADIAGLGSIEIRAMKEAGYDETFSAAVTAASSLQAPLIPPSMPAVTIGGIVGVSIGGLFLGGAIPGLLIGVACAIVVAWRTKERDYPYRVAPVSAHEFWGAIKGGVFALIAPVIIVGGIVLGVFSPTEAAAVAAVYSGIVAFASGDVTIKQFPAIIGKAAFASAQIYILLGGSAVLEWVLSYEGFPMMLTEWVIHMTGGSKFMFLLMVNLLFLFWGMWLPIISAQLLLCPILFPIATKFGIHPVHFGVIAIFNLMIGMLTPPVGSGLFATLSICKVSFKDLVRELIPFLALDIVLLAVITYTPDVVLFLPRLLGFA
ncbi:MAG: TRAP transporter large permease [Firmicutes bacterium]|nr:TRAP transporter large permease [Bacillota bacterium]